MLSSFKKLTSLVLVCVLSLTFGIPAFAQESTKAPTNLTSSSLLNYATSQKVNIIIYDADGLLESEIHADGEKIDYTVDKNSKSIKEFTSKNGNRTIVSQNPDNTVTLNTYSSSNKLISQKLRGEATTYGINSINDETSLIKKASLGLLGSA